MATVGADPTRSLYVPPSRSVVHMSVGSSRRDRNPRELVRFYLLDHRTALGKTIDVALLVLNLVFVVVFVAETYPLSARTETLLWDAEVAIAAVFLVEYVLRLYGAESRLDELFNGYTLVDLLAILPTVVVFALPSSAVAYNVGFLRAVRVVRVLRFYRFTRDAEFFFGTVSDNALRASKLLLTVLVLFFVSAGLFYSAEHAANPGVDTFGDAFYYTVVALSTVGFGDITPVTAAGRWVTVATILAGIIVVPWQASKIVREWAHAGKVDVTCPDCGSHTTTGTPPTARPADTSSTRSSTRGSEPPSRGALRVGRERREDELRTAPERVVGRGRPEVGEPRGPKLVQRRLPTRRGEEHLAAHPAAADRLEAPARERHQEPTVGSEHAGELRVHRRVVRAGDVEDGVVGRDGVDRVGRERHRRHLPLEESRLGHPFAGQRQPPAGEVEPDAAGREVGERPGAVPTANVEDDRVGREFGEEVVEERGV